MITSLKPPENEESYVNDFYIALFDSIYEVSVGKQISIDDASKRLENSLDKHIRKFLLELGKGFMFVGSQYRITLGNNHYYVDMVFYNKILRSYVLIELKTSKLMPEAVGQMNMYLNYFKAEVNDEFDNEPVGIILCTDKRKWYPI